MAPDPTQVDRCRYQPCGGEQKLLPEHRGRRVCRDVRRVLVGKRKFLDERRLLSSIRFAHRRHSRRDSASPPTPHDPFILEQSDAHVGNYFDGTRKLSLNSFETWWLKLTSEMCVRYNVSEQMTCPVMLARVALLWQGYWVKTHAGKPSSIIVLDQARYRRRWQAVRRRLSAKFPEGQGDWPDWLTAQPSSSSGSSSPGASGRSS